MQRFNWHFAGLNGAALGLQLIALVCAWKVLHGELEPAPAMAAFAAAGGVALFAWRINRRCSSAIDDTPTSKVASAAQGYVELLGRGEQFPDQRTLSPLTHLPCLWYRYTVEERVNELTAKGQSRTRYIMRDSGSSDNTFKLNDGTGSCVVDPRGAEIHTTRHDMWTRGDWRYNEWLLLEQDRLYAIGEFRTIRASDHSPPFGNAVSAKLSEWKADRHALLLRFDADGDGEIDMLEWEAVREQARAEVMKDHQADSVREGYHKLGKPADGRPFILSNKDPDSLAFAYRWWSRLHMLDTWVALFALAWLANQHPLA